jgi:hypothetical protein
VTNYGGAIPQRKLGVFEIPAIITGISKYWQILDSWSGRTSILTNEYVLLISWWIEVVEANRH